MEKYIEYQIAHEEEKLDPGAALPLIHKLLNLRYPDTGEHAVEVILVSKNDANTGLRIFNSIQEYNLNITRACFTNGRSLFSDEAERIFQEKGLDEFKRNEMENSEVPLHPGPFKAFLEAIYRIQKAYQTSDEKPIRTALVTSRNAPSHKRAIKTLRHWGIGVDEAFFLGGLDKTPILQRFKPHIFFDDQQSHCQRARSSIPTGHVPYIDKKD